MWDTTEQALEVAESGNGLAMGRRPMVDRWMERGRLVMPFGGGGSIGPAYYLCRPSAVTPTTAGRLLERWLTKKVKCFRTGWERFITWHIHPLSARTTHRT
jgi:LysR family transcriptional regulator, glycine cleavage system transcriptional activator